MKIFPTAFKKCTLRCTFRNKRRVITLFMQHSRDTKYVEVGFSESFFENGDVVFQCDLMEARDGGNPYLFVHDVVRYGNKVLPTAHEARLAMIDDMLHRHVTFPSEFRLNIPDLFDLDRLKDVFDFVLPNYRAVALGVGFSSDFVPNPNPQTISELEEQEFVIQKTDLPEVYELYIGIHAVPGNNIAYIPTLTVAKYVRSILGHRMSARMVFKYNVEREKWTPEVNHPKLSGERELQR